MIDGAGSSSGGVALLTGLTNIAVLFGVVLNFHRQRLRELTKLVAAMYILKHDDPPYHDSSEWIGRQIAEHFGTPEEQVRYATYRPFVDGGLTTESRWERLIDGQWVDAEWLPDLHRTPAR